MLFLLLHIGSWHLFTRNVKPFKQINFEIVVIRKYDKSWKLFPSLSKDSKSILWFRLWGARYNPEMGHTAEKTRQLTLCARALSYVSYKSFEIVEYWSKLKFEFDQWFQYINSCFSTNRKRMTISSEKLNVISTSLQQSFKF